jgi:hypothetical protein
MTTPACTPTWRPAADPVHRLIQLLDVFAVSHRRYLRILGVGDFDALRPTDPDWFHRRDAAIRDNDRLMTAVFSEGDD